VRFGVLGTLAAWDAEGAEVTLGGDRQRALLASLLARAGEIVSADRLVDLLWGEGQPAHPGAALQSQVHRLRRILDRDVQTEARLVTRPPGYGLIVDEAALDASRFAALVERAGRASDPADAVALLDEALSLWRGNAYGEFADSDVARIEAIRLDEARLAAEELRAEALLRLGRPAELVARLEALVAEHPLREEARSVLMRALYELGRHADALARYADYRRQLADELGLEPSARLRRLEAQILRQQVPSPREPVAARAGGAAGGAPTRAAVGDGRAAVAAAGLPGPEDGPPEVSLDELQARYVTDVRGRRIACAELGSGRPVVASPGWVSSLDVIAAGRDPRSSILQRLATRCRLTMYDRSGSGLSPDPPGDFGLDASVDELEAVVRQAGPPVAVFAMSQAGPVAVALAARKPELVSRLVLFGTYADGPSVFTNIALRASISGLVRAHWGLGSRVMAELYRPGTSAEAALLFAQAMRDSADPDVAAGYLEAIYDTSVTELLPRVRTPALVLHYRKDRVIPYAGGQQLATGLPDARFVPLAGAFHLPDAADLPRIVSAILEFLSEDQAPPA
jgi:DNA-binding SARP family transcriptional activator/pimeloyl-ACP methyl ester carboxylesterase